MSGKVAENTREGKAEQSAAWEGEEQGQAGRAWVPVQQQGRVLPYLQNDSCSCSPANRGSGEGRLQPGGEVWYSPVPL